MKILIADDHELFLKGLEFVLSDFDKTMEFVCAKSYTEIFTILEHNRDFDILLTDLAMPGGNWLEAINKIHRLLPDMPIVILSAVFDREIVQKTIENGVSGYIPKTSSNAVILGAISLVLSGGVYIPPELLSEVSNHETEQLKILECPQTATSEEHSPILTPRQIDVLKLIAKGEPNKQIAFELGLSEGTVKLHVTAILKILGVVNRTGAVIEAARKGIISKDDINI